MQFSPLATLFDCNTR